MVWQGLGQRLLGLGLSAGGLSAQLPRLMVLTAYSPSAPMTLGS